MLKNYFITALRTLQRNKIYSFINIFGLALGIACCIMITLIIAREITYDRFHPASENLYRVVQDVSWGGGSTWTSCGAPMGPALKKDFPEVEEMTRIFRTARLVSRESIDLRVQEDNFIYADPSFFTLFNFPLINGDPESALNDPYSILITESIARKYFADENPVGQLLRIENDYDIRITGVLADPPENTHIDFDFVASFKTLNQEYQQPVFTNWWGPTVRTYVRLRPDADVAAFNENRLAEFVKNYREPQYASAIIPRFQAVTDIHLYGNPGPGSIQFVYIFSLIGLFVLIIACANYMNLATARAAGRAREVGVRKAIGAGRGQIIRQFFSESFCVTIFALLIGLVLTELLMPFFNEISGRSLAMPWTEGWLWLGLLTILFVVGLVSGSYPALALSRFSIVQVLHKSADKTAGGAKLRKGLVVLQFSISIALIIATFVVFSQLSYMRGKSLGFDSEQVAVLLTWGDRSVQKGYEAFKNDLETYPGISSVAASNWFPGMGGFAQWGFSIEGMTAGREAASPLIIYGSENFMETVGLDVRQGRGFTEDFSGDINNAFLLNETALSVYGISEPLGNSIRLFGESRGDLVYEKKGQVVGVVEDFHITALRDPIVPTTITLAESSEYYNYFLVRFSSGDYRVSVAQVTETWQTHFPDRAFHLVFVDEQIQEAYGEEARFGQVIGAFALFAILIACLGLFGLAAFTAERRTKEIGIRKVLGASLTSIVILISREFALLIGLGLLLATPFAYFGMEWWLTDFAYRVDVTPAIFFWAGLLAFVIGLLTVGYQALRAALSNPIKALRYE